MLRSKPMSRAGNAGTAASSADRKSSSVMPYSSCSSDSTASFTRSPPSPAYGMLPMTMLSASPVMPSSMVLRS